MNAAKPTRTIEQIIADKRAAGKNLGGRPKGAKNKATLEREARERELASKQQAQQAAQPEQPAPQTEQQQGPSLDEKIAALKAESQPVQAEAPKPEEKPVGAAQPEQAPPPAMPAAPAMPAGFTISGKLLLVVLDAFFSNGIALLLNRFAGYDIGKEQMRLTKEERDELAAIADEVARMIQLNPVLVLSASMGAMYLGKIPAKQKKQLL